MPLDIQFAPELNFFLKPVFRNRRVVCSSERRASIKDVIESLGVPHTEVGRILVNGRSRGFSSIPGEKDRVEVHAVCPPYDVTRPSFLRPVPLENLRFIADVNVMKLGRLLLFLGFDTVCSPALTDSGIADLAARENRIVLTRDTLLLQRKKIVFGRRIQRNLPYDQLREVIEFFGLHGQVRFLSRCSQCNTGLNPVDKSDVHHLLEPKTRIYYHKFLQCPDCLKVFWKGSHCGELAKRFEAAGVFHKGSPALCNEVL